MECFCCHKFTEFCCSQQRFLNIISFAINCTHVQKKKKKKYAQSHHLWKLHSLKMALELKLKFKYKRWGIPRILADILDGMSCNNSRRQKTVIIIAKHSVFNVCRGLGYAYETSNVLVDITNTWYVISPSSQTHYPSPQTFYPTQLSTNKITKWNLKKYNKVNINLNN